MASSVHTLAVLTFILTLLSAESKQVAEAGKYGLTDQNGNKGGLVNARIFVRMQECSHKQGPGNFFL